MRSNTHILISVVLGQCLSYGLVLRGEELQVQRDPVLKKIESNVKTLLDKERISPAVSWQENSLDMSLDTQKFMVHGSFMTGEFSERATEEVGPRSRGFILEIERRHDDPATIQAVLPQTLHGPYWETYISAPGIGTNKGKAIDYYFLRFSYGRRLNEKLRAEMQKMVDDTIRASGNAR